MPVLSKFCGIAIRMLYHQKLSARFHAFHGDTELVVGIAPLRIIQGNAPGHVRQQVLDWASWNQRELLAAWQQCESRRVPNSIPPLNNAVLQAA